MPIARDLQCQNPWTMSVQCADKWRLLCSEKANQAAIILKKIYIDLAINMGGKLVLVQHFCTWYTVRTLFGTEGSGRLIVKCRK